MSWLSTRIFTVTRYEQGEWVEGKFEKGDETSFDIDGSVQPASPNELLSLSEGERQRETLKVYTDTLLRTANEATGEIADEIDIAGVLFQVRKVSHWVAPGGVSLTHYKAILQKKNDQGSTP